MFVCFSRHLKLTNQRSSLQSIYLTASILSFHPSLNWAPFLCPSAADWEAARGCDLCQRLMNESCVSGSLCIHCVTLLDWCRVTSSHSTWWIGDSAGLLCSTLAFNYFKGFIFYLQCLSFTPSSHPVVPVLYASYVCLFIFYYWSYCCSKGWCCIVPILNYNRHIFP